MLEFFLDPLFRGPFLGSMLMCLASAIMGSYVFVRRRALIGEVLSHAAYPGLVLVLAIGSATALPSDDVSIVYVLIGAFVFSFLGMVCIEKLHTKLQIHLDAAMCLILALFLGVGIVLASRIQFTHPMLYQQAQVFIYGQAATMTDRHIAIYGILSLCVVGFMVIRFRQIELIAFDRLFAHNLKMRLHRMDMLIMLFLILAIVVGIRSVGVVMMAGMLIAPAVAARAFSQRFSHVLVLSCLVGVVSGYGGNAFSVVFGKRGVAVPTGPMILLCAVAISVLALLFAPKTGTLVRSIRIFRFRRKCLAENLLKTLWKTGSHTSMTCREIQYWHPISKMRIKWVLFFLQREGWVSTSSKGVLLTVDGVKRAAHLVRLHRLWELYLSTCLKVDQERVHHSAEEMEHIITPELECSLTRLLNDPDRDPHHKPIPKGDLTC